MGASRSTRLQLNCTIRILRVHVASLTLEVLPSTRFGDLEFEGSRCWIPLHCGYVPHSQACSFEPLEAWLDFALVHAAHFVDPAPVRF